MSVHAFQATKRKETPLMNVTTLSMFPTRYLVKKSHTSVLRTTSVVDMSTVDEKHSLLTFDVSKSVNHLTFQINQPTRCNTFTSLLLDVHTWLNMFRASPRPSSGAYNCTRSLWFYRGKEAAGALLHDQQRSSPFLPTVEPEAPSAVVCS